MYIILSISVFAVVFSEMLITRDNIFAFYGRLLERLDEKGLDWLAMPLGYCPKCFGGQLAFWAYIFLPDYNVISHIFFVAWVIFFTEILTLIYGKIQM